MRGGAPQRHHLRQAREEGRRTARRENGGRRGRDVQRGWALPRGSGSDLVELLVMLSAWMRRRG